VAENFVNLNEQGLLSQAGRNYDGTAQDSDSEARNFGGRMDASRTYLRGSAGTTFTGVAQAHTGNLSLLGVQIADQAYRAVQAEQAVVGADDDARTAQAGAQQTVEGLTPQAASRITV
jgi:hypothetical protein